MSLEEVDQFALEIVRLRTRPLLVLYYPEIYGAMVEDDIKDVYDEFRRRGLEPSAEIELDVLLHTRGGDPSTGYHIAQVIRDFSKHVVMLVPFYAYSAGTLTCLSANEIRLGHYALLSPIDITISGVENFESIELMNIDYYMEFVGKSRQQIEEHLADITKHYGRVDLSTNVEEPLLVELVRQVGALNIGKFFRERTLTGHYAEVLLDDYMFATMTDKVEKSINVIRQLLFECPSHEFEIDYHLAKRWDLPVTEMETKESDLTKALVTALKNLEIEGTICKYVESEYKVPFFRLYLGDDTDANQNTRKERNNKSRSS